MRKLNADELGAKGENRFAETCADARLICNKADRDRAGWDFLVEFPFDTLARTASLDKRPSPISCHFQVKTLWQENDRIKLRLSSAERLAKELKPAFIYVLKVDDELGFRDAFCIHLHGYVLAKVLKRLRTEEAKGRRKINTQSISLSATRDGARIGPTGDALRQELLRTCKDGIEAYVAEKRSQLNNLGFEPFRYQTDFTLLIDDREKLIDVFLGKEKAQIKDFKVFETRFGIKLPVNDQEEGNGTISIRPERADRCRLLVRSLSENPVNLEADVFFSPPNLAELGRKILITNPLVEISILSKDKGTDSEVRFHTNSGNVFEQIQSVEDWLTCIRFFLILSKGHVTISVIPEKFRSPPLPLSISKPVNPDQSQNLARLAKLLEATERVLNHCGTTAKFALDDLITNSQAILGLDGMLRGAEISPIVVEIEKFNEPNLDGSRQLDTLIVNFIQIGSVNIGYSFSAKMEKTEVAPNCAQLTSTSIVFRDIQELRSFPDDYDTFVDAQKQKTRDRGLIVNHPSNLPSEEKG